MQNTVPPSAAAYDPPTSLRAELCALLDELRLTLTDRPVDEVPAAAWLAVGNLTAAAEGAA